MFISVSAVILNFEYGAWNLVTSECAVADFTLLGSKITTDGDCSHEIKTLAPWKKSYYKPRKCIQKQRHLFVNKGPYNQSYGFFSSHQSASSVTQSCLTLCNPINWGTPGLPVHHQLLESTQTHVHWVGDANQPPPHPPSSPSPPALNLSQHQGLFQLQHQSFK